MTGPHTLSTTDPTPRWGWSVLGWFGTGSVAVAVIAWLALVLHYEYQVAWLGDYVVGRGRRAVSGGHCGIVLTRSVQRWGAACVRPVVLRLAFC